MRIFKKTLFITATIILMFILLASCASLFDRVSYYENYVPKGYGENSIYEFTYDDVILKFKWSNENTTTGPYNLFVIVETLNENIDNIFIENIQIISSTNKNYEFTSIIDWPFLIYNVDKKDTHLNYNKNNENIRYYHFNDFFDFDFKNGETFKLQIKIRYEGKNINKEELIEIEFEPYLEELHAPFV